MYNTTYSTGHIDGINYQKDEDAAELKRQQEAQAEKDREAQEESDNSSGIWGTIGSALSFGLSLI